MTAMTSKSVTSAVLIILWYVISAGPARADEQTCSVVMGEYGYDSVNRVAFVENATVTASFLALVQCIGEPSLRTHTFRIVIDKYVCQPFLRQFPENPSAYTGVLPEGYRGSLRVAVEGVGEQLVPIVTAPKRDAACGNRRTCRRPLSSLSRREKTQLCTKIEESIRAPRRIVIIGKSVANNPGR